MKTTTRQRMSLVVKSPCKVNLLLNVLGRRADGFHEVETILQPVPLFDELRIEKTGAGLELSCSDSRLSVGEDNLVHRAAKAFLKKVESGGAEIHLQKNLPLAAGIGAGSSNAAWTLRGLNELFENPLSAEQLQELAADLGSDVPFFLQDNPALATGRGEIIVPAESPPPYKVVLFKPQFSVPTPDAYRKCLDADSVPGINYEPQTHESLTLVNDLEKPVFAKHRYLAELKHWLSNRRDTQAVLMSGSGSTIFAILHRRAKPIVLINSAHRHFDENLWTWSGTL